LSCFKSPHRICQLLHIRDTDRVVQRSPESAYAAVAFNAGNIPCACKIKKSLCMLVVVSTEANVHLAAMLFLCYTVKQLAIVDRFVQQLSFFIIAPFHFFHAYTRYPAQSQQAAIDREYRRGVEYGLMFGNIAVGEDLR
jgi:hypothetical protein